MENLPSTQIFNHEKFGKIRGVMIEGVPYFVGKDVAVALGYKEPEKAIRDHVENEDKGVSKLDTPGGKQSVTIINESGLYSLILSSKLPKAKEFKHWVTSEVLPSIRKTGEYKIKPEPSTPKNPEKSLECAKLLLDAAKLTDNASLRDELLSQMARLVILW